MLEFTAYLEPRLPVVICLHYSDNADNGIIECSYSEALSLDRKNFVASIIDSTLEELGYKDSLPLSWAVNFDGSESLVINTLAYYSFSTCQEIKEIARAAIKLAA